MLIRAVKEGDAEALLGLLKHLDDETRFMMYEPGERATTVREQEESLRTILSGGNGTVLLAEEAGRPPRLPRGDRGRLPAQPPRRPTGRRGSSGHAGRGIGSALMEEAELWARGHGIHRLELTVMTHNVAAVAHYEKASFAVEGTRRHSMLVAGSYVDEHYMAKLLV